MVGWRNVWERKKERKNWAGLDLKEAHCSTRGFLLGQDLTQGLCGRDREAEEKAEEKDEEKEEEKEEEKDDDEQKGGWKEGIKTETYQETLSTGEL
jgi:hypothetical protein